MKLITSSTLNYFWKKIVAMFATKTDVETGLAGKASIGHDHNNMYYTEAEMNTKLLAKSDTTHGHSAADVGARPSTWVPAWGEVTGKPNTFTPTLGTTSTTAFRGDYGNTAYAHSQSVHAPSNAQKNSDITKAEIEAKLTGAITTHNHDSQYYTEGEVDTMMAGKANSIHGNHVPTTQTANNTTFLRNDNTWQVVTPANIGARPSTWVPAWGDVTGKPALLALGTTSTTAFRGDYGNTAYTHSQSVHAPSNAQKNSDITKAEIEAKLTGDVSSHNHDNRYFTEGEVSTLLAGKSEIGHNHDNAYVNKTPIRLSATADLNTVTTGGNYTVASNTVVNSPRNYGRLVVYGWDLSTKWVTQVFYSDVSNEVYTRCSTNETATTWTAWSKMYSTNFKPTWDDVAGKPSTYNPTIGTTSTTAFRGDYGNTAYAHSQSTHAPTNAQKNSDITKAEIEAKLTGAITTHNHDGQYYTEGEVDTMMAGKANSSHGNHVPTTQTANNTVFLRNDNTWQVVTPANIGARPSTWVPAWGEVTGKPSLLALGTTSTTAFRGDYGNTAYTHSQSAHAPSTAQKNSDITKAEIEAKLVGDVSSHNHDNRYFTEAEVNNLLAGKSGTGHTHNVIGGATLTIENGDIYLSY